MKAAKARFVFGFPRLKTQHGYHVVEIPIMYLRPDVAFPVYGNDSWSGPHGDLPDNLRGLQCDALEISAQMRADGTPEPFYGWKASYTAMYTVDLRRARAMAKSLERINKMDMRNYQAAGPLPPDRTRAIESVRQAFGIDSKTGFAEPENLLAGAVDKTTWAYLPVRSLYDRLDRIEAEAMKRG